MDNNQAKKINNKNNNGRELFYGIIAVAIFIVMAVGATFAYFTATARSANSSVSTKSTTLELEYISYGSAWSKDDLIPADTTISEYSVEYQTDITPNNLCMDDYGNSICSVYEFQVRNPANSPQTVTLNIVSEVNGFANLNAMAYELSIEDNDKYNSKENGNGTNDPTFKNAKDDPTVGAIPVVDGDGNELYTETPIYVNRDGVKKTLLQYNSSEDKENPVLKSSIDRQVIQVTEANKDADASEKTVKLAENITIDGGQTRTFVIVLYVKNINEDQTKVDASKEFKGRVVVSTGDGTTGVSGQISAAGDALLQSQGE